MSREHNRQSWFKIHHNKMDEYSESSGSGGMTVVSGGSSHDPFEFLDFQG